MVKSMKQEILDYINENSKKISRDVLEKCTANALSSKIMASRSVTSQYLNDLVKDNYLIKIKSRPVVFLSRFQLEKQSGRQITVSEFEDYESLVTFMYGDAKNLEKAIGYDIGLKECIERIKTAVNYPHGGLPVMISGPHGSGKTFLCTLISEYFFDHHLIEREDQYVYLNCNNISDTDFARMLFGYVDSENKVHPGILSTNREGLLVLDDISGFSNDIQERLITYLDNGTYAYANRNFAEMHSRLRIIFSVSDLPQSVFTARFLSRFSSVIEIPSLKDRTINEKISLITHFFDQEALMAKCSVELSESLVNYLIDLCSTREVLGLKQKVRQIFAKAYRSDQDTLRIGIHALGEDAAVNLHDSEEKYHALSYFKESADESIHVFLKQYPELLGQFNDGKISEDAFYENLFSELGKFNDSIIFNQNYLEKPLKRFRSCAESVNRLLEDSMNMELSAFLTDLFARYLYVQSYFFKETDRKVGEDVLGSLEKKYPDEYSYVKEFSISLARNFGIVIEPAFMAALILDILLFSSNITNRKTLALIMCHGNSTASSIASAANTILSAHIFDAFDMPLSTDIREITGKVRDYLLHKKSYDSLILLVDMGSLTSIAENLNDFRFSIGIVNNVSTSSALYIGEQIKKEIPVEDILEHLDEQVPAKHQMISRNNKEKAILFIGENNISAADRMKDLFEHSIPVNTDIKLISCDYLTLRDDPEHEILNEYDVLFAEGIFDPQIPELTFINLGDIVSFEGIRQVDEALASDLSKEEIEEFHRQLLKNFSLENLVENLTILNPGPLLNLAEECIASLMRRIQYRISEKTLIGLYVHTCCFVERMVTRVPVLTYQDLEEFHNTKQDFIQSFRASFRPIMDHYRIDIPESEIAYIYEYIENDRKDKERKES